MATEHGAAVIFQGNAFFQEKIDGANCGMVLVEGHPVIRNRSKLLRKGDLSKKLNPSLAQFAAAFTWFYENREKFEAIGPYAVYGEWMVQQHGQMYDQLSDWFIPYDLYDYEVGKYINPGEANSRLSAAGFSVIPFEPRCKTYEEVETLANKPSNFSSSIREGVYVKVADEFVTARFKMVRQGFRQGCLLGEQIKKNRLK